MSTVRRLVAPIQAFLRIEAASGIVLVVATVAAMVWVNSPGATSYHAVWDIVVPLRMGDWDFSHTVQFWINDGLMTIFFFVVGLEIRRELHGGELAEVRRAALPLAAAVGGMLLPATIYAALNYGRAGSAGWGVAMATDIAFAVGVLALLGPRVPPALRVLLLSLAVIDDIGAILVIAVFYSDGVNVAGLGIAAIGLATIAVQRRMGVERSWLYIPAGVTIWAGLYRAGIHPTLAGVIVGLMTPATPSSKAPADAVAPVETLVDLLHGIVSFGIMPLFALANAGIVLGGAQFGGDATWVFAGIVLGLVVGKAAGITLASLGARAVKIALLPRGVSSVGITLVGLVGGIGFTMAIFIAQLAFPAGPMLETAKLAILAGSGTAAILGLVFGVVVLPRRERAAPEPGVAQDEAAAESSTDA